MDNKEQPHLDDDIQRKQEAADLIRVIGLSTIGFFLGSAFTLAFLLQSIEQVAQCQQGATLHSNHFCAFDNGVIEFLPKPEVDYVCVAQRWPFVALLYGMIIGLLSHVARCIQRDIQGENKQPLLP